MGMKVKKIFACGAIALLAASAPKIRAADAQVNANVDLPKTETRVTRDRDADLAVRSDVDRDREKVRHANKASGLLGMEVRNRDNQKLGEIKDLVMENPGKVSYAVLAVGGFLGIGEKLIALPPHTLHVSDAGDYLILNADKAKIQAAPGFAATLWPSPNDPDVERFWGDIRATGGPAGAEHNRRSDVDLDTDRHRAKVDVNVDSDTKHKIYTDADGNKVKVDTRKD